MSTGLTQNEASEFQRWYEVGIQSVEQESWQYALDCLSKAVHADPNHRDARKQKHRASRRVYAQRGKPRRAEQLKLASLKSRVATAEARGDLVAADQLAEQVLARNPWEASMFAAIARCADKRQCIEVAEYGWMCAVKIDDSQARWFRALGDLLHRTGRHQEAKGCYARIQKIDPGSRSSEELMQAVDVAALMRDGGVHLRRRTDDAVELAEGAPPAADDASGKNLQRAEQLILQAENFVRNNQLGQAMGQYEQACSLLPDNISVKDRADDVQLALLRKRASAAAAAAHGQPTNSQPMIAARQHVERCHQKEFELLQERFRRDETSLLLAFRLADVCRRTNRLEEAIALFQKCEADPSLHAEALIGLGECCLRSQQAAAGRRYLESALKEVSWDSHPNSFQLAHYWLGRYFEAAKAMPQAVWHFQKVSENEPQFRDIAKRLTSLRAAENTRAIVSEPNR